MAAGRESQGTKSREILSQLIDRVGELSDALDAQECSNNQIRLRREQNEDTKTEIRRSLGDPQIAIPVQVLPPIQLLCSLDRLPQCHKAKIQLPCIQ